MTLTEKRELVSESLRQLGGDPRFQSFLEAVQTMRNEAIRAACADKVLRSRGKTVAALGEIRAYEDILALAEENKPEQFI
jgi:hypothetical protein